jgi:hypothetical protein
VVIFALEFWTSLAEHEADADPKTSQNFVSRFLAHVVNLLFTLLTQVKEDEDDETTSVANAAGICLKHISSAVQDAVWDGVLDRLVISHFGAEDWHQRDASATALGAVLSSLSADKAKQIVAATLPSLLAKLVAPNTDPIPKVRESVAWVVGTLSRCRGGGRGQSLLVACGVCLCSFQPMRRQRSPLPLHCP